MATWMDQVTRGWLIYELTNSSFQLGLVRGIQAIPILLLSPLAGSAADRYSRKMQVVVAQVVDGVLYSALAVLILTGNIEPWQVYVTASAFDRWTFQQPSRAAMIAMRGRLAKTHPIGSIDSFQRRAHRRPARQVSSSRLRHWRSYGRDRRFFILWRRFWTIQLRSPQLLCPAHRRSAHSILGQSIPKGGSQLRKRAVRAALSF